MAMYDFRSALCVSTVADSCNGCLVHGPVVVAPAFVVGLTKAEWDNQM